MVSLFGDVIYEGARSVAGPYLYIFGGSAFVVAFVAGFGEFAIHEAMDQIGAIAGPLFFSAAFLILGDYRGYSRFFSSPSS